MPVINFIYQAATFLMTSVAFPFLCISRKTRTNLLQRYGKWDLPQGEYLWLHAASLGEVNALVPLIEILRKSQPDCRLLITCLTETGLQMTKHLADFSYLLPFDNYIWIRKAVGNSRIRKLIISETEFWPALVLYAAKNSVPIYHINTRISDYTLNVYRVLKFFLANLFSKYTRIIATNPEAKERLLSLGVESAKIEIAGYSKYDILPRVKNQKEADAVRKEFFENSLPVLTLGSIRPEEEKIWFPAVHKATKEGYEFNLIVAPRHTEKFEYFSEKLKEFEINFCSYSEIKNQIEKKRNIVLLDTIGRLSEVYSFTNLAFIGATLVNIGGHNPLEPACYNCAVCSGPYFNNVRDVILNLQGKNAIFFIRNQEEAYDSIKKLASGDPLIAQYARNAHGFWKENYGASERIAELLEIKK